MSAVPKLRFPEFDGEWTENTLGDYFQFKNGLNSDKSAYGSGTKFINVLDILSDRPITHSSIIGSVVVSETELQKNRVSYGDIVFQRSSETREDVGLSNVYLDEDHDAVFGGFVIRGTATQEINPEFINSALKTASVRKDITSRSGGSTRYNIGQESLAKVLFFSPSLPEQQKIASFLSSVDKEIDLLRQKKDALDLYKKGLMQKIFSQEIRFNQDDGSDFPEWEEVTVGDMAERHVRGLTSSTLNFYEKGYPVYGASGVIGYIDNYISERRYIGVVKDGAGVGRVFEAVEQSSLLSTMESIVPRAGFSFGFVKQVIKDIDFKKFTTGSTIPHVYFKDYSKESYPCPTYEEQEKIADLLDLFDAKIQKTSSQIEQMETFKKGLLQQMFV